MARHAGFAAVATVKQGMINAAIASYWRGQMGPFFFPLPTMIGTPPFAVAFSGLIEMQPPTVELHPNSGNLITVQFAFLSTLRAQFGQQVQTVTVQLAATVDVPLAATPQDGRIVLTIDTQQVVFQPLAVQLIAGPALLNPMVNALQSPQLAAIVQNFVRSLPPITASPPLLSSDIEFIQPLNLPWYITTEWFRVKLSASKIVVKVMEFGVTVGVDLWGFVYVIDAFGQKVPTSVTFGTAGDETALVDLTAVKGLGSIYLQHFTQMTDPAVPPYLLRKPEPKGGLAAVAINMNFLSEVVAKQISPQIAQTPISVSPHPNITLWSIGIGYSKFNTFDGGQDGLVVRFKVGVEEGPGADVEGRIFLQAYLRQADGTTAFVMSNPDAWLMYAAKVEVDLPWWITFAAAVAMITFGAAVPALAPMVVVMGLGLLGEIARIRENAEAQTQQQVQGSAGQLAIPTGDAAPFPGLTLPDWWWYWQTVPCVSFTPESFDLAVAISPVRNPQDEPRATMTPDKWQATNKDPINVTLKLRDDLAKLGGKNLMVSWTVRRADTGQIVATAVKAYNDLAGNGILVPHHSKELYLVDAFDVTCTATLTIGSQVGDIWTGTKTISIEDPYVDRHHKYVEWPEHEVYFLGPGSVGLPMFEGWVTWKRIRRRSRIHRTAVSARCLVLGPVTGGHEGFKYSDKLPFPWDQLNLKRKIVCDYCFFGGPEKTVPIPVPEEDWF